MALHYAQNVNPLIAASSYVEAAMDLVEITVQHRDATSTGWVEADDPFPVQVASKVESLDLGRSAALTMITGESWILGAWAGMGRMGWKVGSIKEVRWTGGEYAPPRWHTAGDVTGVELWTDDMPMDQRPTMIRVYKPSYEYGDVPMSPLLGQQAQALLEQILVMQLAELTASKSRLNNGILAIPSEAVGALALALAKATGDGTMITDRTIREQLQDIILNPIENPNDIASQVPLVLYAPGQTLTGLTHLTLQKMTDPDKFLALQDGLNKELAMLLPVPEMVLRGLVDSNHWNGALEDDNAVKFYWGPMANRIFDALTEAWYQPYLAYCRAMGIWRGNPLDWRIRANTAALAKRPSDAATVISICDAGGAGWKWGRAELGIPEGAKPDPEELKEYAAFAQLKTGLPAPSALPAPDVSGALPAPTPAEPVDTLAPAAAALGAAEPRQIPVPKTPENAGGSGMVAMNVDPGSTFSPMPDDPHITLAVFEDGVDLRTVMAAIQPLDLPTASLTGSIGGIGRFPSSASSDGMDVIWAPVDVPGLAELRTLITDALGTAGIAVKGDHGWTPHMTLAYVEPTAPTPDPIPPVPVSFGGVAVSIGQNRWEFPFTPAPVAAAAKARAIDVPCPPPDRQAVMGRLRTLAAPVVAARQQASVKAELAALSAELNAIDNEARTALLALSDAHMGTALRAVGRKVKQTADRRVVRDPWRQAVAAAAPKDVDLMFALDVPGIVARLALEDDVREKAVIAMRGFAGAARRILERAAKKGRAVLAAFTGVDEPFRGDIDEGVRLLETAVTDLTVARAMQSEIGGAARAETPMQLVGAAVAAAGGWPVTKVVGDVAAPGSPATDRGAGGIAFSADVPEHIDVHVRPRISLPTSDGALVTTVARVQTEYEWLHDHPQQPFPPHAQLHRRVAATLDGFDGYYPGDHPRCLCHVAPRLILNG